MMNHRIILFVHKIIQTWPSTSFPYLSIEGIVEHTLRRNKTIRSNRRAAIQFIFSGTTETTKRINRLARSSQAYLDEQVRYINGAYYKVDYKNTYFF